MKPEDEARGEGGRRKRTRNREKTNPENEIAIAMPILTTTFFRSLLPLRRPPGAASPVAELQDGTARPGIRLLSPQREEEGAKGAPFATIPSTSIPLPQSSRSRDLDLRSHYRPRPTTWWHFLARPLLA